MLTGQNWYYIHGEVDGVWDQTAYSWFKKFKQQNLYKPTSEWEGEMTDI
jgi:hypothetical protein